MTNQLYDLFAHWTYSNNQNKRTILIMSDPHFADPEMIYLRPNYIGDDEQVKIINSEIKKNKGVTLIVLGDVGNAEYISKINADYKILIMGNHDKGASNYKRIIKQVVKCPKCGCTKLNDLRNNDGFSLFKTQCDECGYIGNTFGSDFDSVADNHLFDEVYEGPLMINDRLILSHEPIENLPEYMFNIHGHDHGKWFSSDRHLNVCVELIDYKPLNLSKLLKTGLLSKIKSIHRMTIDTATERKSLKNEDKN